MTVFKYLMTSIWRMKWHIFTYALIFFILSAVNQGLDPQERGDFSNTRLDLVLVRQEDSKLGDAFQDYLEENHDVELSSKPVEELRERIFIGEMDGIIVLPENLEEGILKKTSPVQIITNNSNSSSLVHSMTNGYFTFANAVLTAGQTDFEALNQAFSKEAKVTLLQGQESNKQTEASIWASFYFNFMTYALIAIFIGLFGLLLSNFQETKVLQRQLISSTSLVSINKSKLMACGFVAFFITALFILGALVFRPGLVTQPIFLKYVLVSLAFAAAALSMAFLASVIIGNNRFLYSGLSTVLGLGLSFTSGVFVPLEMLSEPVLNFAKLFPVYYVVKSNQTMDSDLASYLPTIGILLLFALFYFVLAMAISRVKSGNKLIAF